MSAQAVGGFKESLVGGYGTGCEAVEYSAECHEAWRKDAHFGFGVGAEVAQRNDVAEGEEGKEGAEACGELLAAQVFEEEECEQRKQGCEQAEDEQGHVVAGADADSIDAEPVEVEADECGNESQQEVEVLESLYLHGCFSGFECVEEFGA